MNCCCVMVAYCSCGPRGVTGVYMYLTHNMHIGRLDKMEVCLCQLQS